VVSKKSIPSVNQVIRDPQKEYMYAGNEIWEEEDGKKGVFKQIWPPKKEEADKPLQRFQTMDCLPSI
jgi:hypothetical protein